jgi:hypothetical protein
VRLPLKFVARAAFVALIVGSLLIVGSAYATDGLSDTPTEAAEQQYAANSSRPIVPPSNGTTVIAGDSNTWTGRESENPRSKGELVAFNPNGSVLYTMIHTPGIGMSTQFLVPRRPSSTLTPII